MPLSMESAFDHSDIAGISQVKADKIWLLKGRGTDELIIKMESRVSHGEMKAASPVLKAIDPMNRMKPLKATEMEAMNSFCTTLFNGPLEGHPTFSKDKLYQLILALRKKEPFAKMRKQIVMDLDSALRQRLGGQEDAMRQFTQALMNKGGLEMLGQIIAGDLFNGNNDRFEFSEGVGGVAVQLGNLTVDMRCLVNAGNILMTASNGKFKPSMLDYLDPFADAKNLDMSLQDVEKRRPWGGRKLLTPDGRRKISILVIADLEDLIYAPPHKCSSGKKLGKDAEKRLCKGLELGIVNIISALDFRGAGSGKSKLPKVVIDRYDLLSTWKK